MADLTQTMVAPLKSKFRFTLVPPLACTIPFLQFSPESPIQILHYSAAPASAFQLILLMKASSTGDVVGW
jgi:hypothetical protein